MYEVPLYLPALGLSFQHMSLSALYGAGVPRSNKSAPPEDPTVGLCLGS